MCNKYSSFKAMPLVAKETHKEKCKHFNRTVLTFFYKADSKAGYTNFKNIVK